jgi:hypothetical protein
VSPVVVIVGVVALVGGLIYVGLQMEKKRTEAMQLVCQAMGFAFEETGDLDRLRGFGDLPLFDRGHSKRARNVMTGRTADREVLLFDYRYTTGSGKNSHTWSQTVALYPNGASGLPDLDLTPENVFHKIGQVFGYQDIDFDQSPDFSNHYLLRGNDEAAIRSAFPSDALAFFGQQHGWHVEVRGGHVAVYRSGKLCKPPEAPAYLADTLRVLMALHPAT